MVQMQRRRLQAIRTALAHPHSAVTAGLSSSTAVSEHVVGATEANNAGQDRERNNYYAVHRTIVEYTPGQSMHIFHPKDFQPKYSDSQQRSPKAIPAVVFFPGGGFRNCGQTAFYRQAVHLATRGMVAGVCSYQVEPEPTQATRDAGVAEAAAAVEFMRKHAVELNVDPARVVASGGSAGGYIAAGACFVPLGSAGPGAAGCPNLAVVRPTLDVTHCDPAWMVLPPRTHHREPSVPGRSQSISSGRSCSTPSLALRLAVTTQTIPTCP